jgi:4-amino-4-deoxy-L-arabinose transferase-like glycosyltransferase
LILGLSAAWISESRVAVMDLPLAVTFCGAVLAVLAGALPAAGALLGLAMLAKGLVPLVLIAPVVWMERSRWREWPRAAAACAAVAGPWYVAMLMVHGRAFFDEFILRHHFSRFSNASLQHVQPWWFFLPVLAGLLFPWFPLLWQVRWPQERRLRTVLLTGGWTLIFFSLSRNKLPGYILPAIPMAALVLGEAARSAPRWLLTGCGTLLGLTPVAAAVLPDAIAGGLDHTALRGSLPAALAVSAIGAAAARWRGIWGIAGMMLAVVAAMVVWTLPALDQRASARSLWQLVEMRRQSYCVESLHRAWRYGLDFYSMEPLPDCERQPRALRIAQEGSLPPQVLVALPPETALPK